MSGAVTTGGMESRTVICCTQLLWLPQLSVAVQVRLIKLIVEPGNAGGCCGNGPNGGCCCGGGIGKILERFPSESVWLPTVIGTGGLATVWAEPSEALTVPP